MVGAQEFSLVLGPRESGILLGEGALTSWTSLCSYSLFIRIYLRLGGQEALVQSGTLVVYKILLKRSRSLYIKGILLGRSNVADNIYLLELMILAGSGVNSLYVSIFIICKGLFLSLFLCPALDSATINVFQRKDVT